MKHLATLFILSLFVSCISTAQIVKEKLFAALPYPSNFSSMKESQNGFYIGGISSENWNAPQFDLWGTYAQTYFILSPQKVSTKAILLPDVDVSQSFGLGGNRNRINSSSAQTVSDSLFVIWSDITEQYGDVGPFVSYLAPTTSLAKYNGDSLQKIFTISNALRPSIASDKSGDVHFVYEIVTQIDSVWSSFSYYSSKVFYQSRNTVGEYSNAIELGKGFFPSIKIRNKHRHVLFFGGDSSNQEVLQLTYAKEVDSTFSAPVVLCSVAISSYYGLDVSDGIISSGLEWNVDSLEGVNVVWRDWRNSGKIHILHYTSGGIQIDSLDSPNAKATFSDDGEVDLFSASVNNDSTVFQMYKSNYGSPLQNIQGKIFPQLLTLNQVIIGTGNIACAILANQSKAYLLKNIATDSAGLFFLSSRYLLNPSSYVDNTNNVWLTGTRDSTNVILSFNINDVGKYDDFIFPLHIGDEFYYYVYPDGGGSSWPETDIVKVTTDTLMLNGKHYFELVSQKFSAPHFLRKDGLQIFQYSPKDSAEFLRFDFSKSEGDTITTFAENQGSIVLSQMLNDERRKFVFEGMPYNFNDFWHVEITDSIGMTRFFNVGPDWQWIGATINGKEYGTILSVDNHGRDVPTDYSLSQNYPNPFNPTTTINYQLPTTSYVSLKVYDAIGREITTLVNELKNAGNYTATFNASQLSSGLYFYVLKAGSFTSTRKMLLLK
jgi:hypothetical protein